MVNSWVEKATSNLLIGPDWAMNMEISDLLNSDPSQAKDVVKGLKRRLRSKNPKVQFLALTLLETIVKNCGDVVHVQVAENNVLNEMFKLVKKKTDFQVKEKMLFLIDTWQEAFGGPRPRYRQFYSIYQDLLRSGVVFPKRPEKPEYDTTPVNDVICNPTNLRNIDSQQDTAQLEADFPSLSLTEIENAHSIMDVLLQMLNAIDPQNKEGFRKEVVVTLVDQCQTFKQRVVHLLHTTSDETLLSQGISLNDELQQLLAKYQSLSSGTPLPEEQPKLDSNGALVSVDAPLIDTVDDTFPPTAKAGGSGDALSDLFAVGAPATLNGWATSYTNQNPKVDLLSGDDFSSQEVDNSLALAPVEENALVLADFYTQNDDNTETSSDLQHAYPTEQIQTPAPGFQSFQPSQPIFATYDDSIVSGSAQYEQSMHTNGTSATSDWNVPAVGQELTISSHGAQSEESFPAPPWESQPVLSEASEVQYPQMQFHQLADEQSFQDPTQALVYGQSAGFRMMAPVMFLQPNTNSSQSTPNYQNTQAFDPNQQGGQLTGMFSQTIQAAGHPMTTSVYQQQQYHNSYQTVGYGQFQQDNQIFNQQMNRLSITDNNNGGYITNNSTTPTSKSSYQQPMKAKPKPEDSLFGDLIDLNKFKANK